MTQPFFIRQKIPRDTQFLKPALAATIVLLHGWGFDSRVWEPLHDLLAQYADVWLVDLSYENQTVDSLSDAILEGLPAKSLLVGWSLGGMLAANITAQSLIENQEKIILGLVTLSANTKFVASESWPSAMPQATFSAFVEGVNKNPARQLKRFSILLAQGEDESREQAAWQNGVLPEFVDKENLLAGLALLNAIDNMEKLKEIKCPSLFLFGKNDALVPSDAAKDLVINNEYHRIVVLENKGHCLHYPQGECHSLIQAFIEQLAGD